MYGFLDRDLRFIVQALAQYPEIDEAVVFGSRAMGNYRQGSDVDLAIFGQHIDRATVRRLSEKLNEDSPLPYFFDVVCYDDIANEELRRHIDSVGKSIYKRE